MFWFMVFCVSSNGAVSCNAPEKWPNKLMCERIATAMVNTAKQAAASSKASFNCYSSAQLLPELQDK